MNSFARFICLVVCTVTVVAIGKTARVANMNSNPTVERDAPKSRARPSP